MRLRRLRPSTYSADGTRIAWAKDMRPRSTTALLTLSFASLVGYCLVARAVSRRNTAADDQKMRDEIQRSRDGDGDVVARAIDPLGKQWLHIPAAAVLSGFLLRQGRGTPAMMPLIASVASDLSSRVFDRLPPNRKPPPGHPDQQKPSFPSGHANETTAVTFTSAYVLSREGYVAPMPAFAVAAILSIASPGSRIYLDRHWPSDVIGGWAFGALWVLLTLSLAERFVKRGDAAAKR